MKITTDKTTTMSAELRSLGAEAIVGNSKSIGTFTGVVLPGATVRVSAVKKALAMTSKNLGKFNYYGNQYYDPDVTSRKYAHSNYKQQKVSIVVDTGSDTITVYSNLASKHILMFFPITNKRGTKLDERIHQCAISYRTENNLKNKHFRYEVAVDKSRNTITNLQSHLERERAALRRAGRLVAKAKPSYM